MTKTLLIKPRLSEKTYALSNQRVYVFDVPKTANKHEVARAVSAQFEVTVSNVNITNISGKQKRIISLTGKRTKNAEGKRSDIKKAYVTLAEGNSLPIFNAIEEAEEQQQATQEKVEKAAAKVADKEAKPARRGLRRAKNAEETT